MLLVLSSCAPGAPREVLAKTELPHFTGAFTPSPLAAEGNLLTGSIWIDGTLRSCAISARSADDHGVVVDLNGNGDLTDDPTVPLTQDGRELQATIEIGTQRRALRLAIEESRNADTPQVIRQYLWTERRGVLHLGGRAIEFALEGFEGRFVGPGRAVFFDLNDDHVLDTKSQYSNERVEVAMGGVTIDGQSYRFRVQPDGSSITLTQTAESFPDPQSLDRGALAPDFAFRDLDGREFRLSGFRGRVVLLYFWGTWCTASDQFTQELLEADRQVDDRDFLLLGVAVGDDERQVREYCASRGIDWTQAVDSRDGPIVSGYRIHAFPTTFLIGRDGRVRMSELRGTEIAKLARATLKEAQQTSIDADPGPR